MIIFVYFIILTTDVAFLLGAFYHELEDASPTDIITLVILQLLFFMTVWSHLSCMLTNPGAITKNIKELDPERMNQENEEIYNKLKHKMLMNHEARQGYENTPECELGNYYIPRIIQLFILQLPLISI